MIRTSQRLPSLLRNHVQCLQEAKVLPASILIRTMSTTLVNSGPSFQYSDLKLTRCEDHQKKPKPDSSSLAFGKIFSDHMLEIHWSSKEGWSRPEILPLHNFSLHPAAKVLHYALEAFEGLKAYRTPNGKIRLFRPDENMKRFLRSTDRLVLPKFDVRQLQLCLQKLIEVDQDWVPSEPNTSLYIRPTIIGTEASLGVSSSNDCIIYAITSPVGPFFKTGYKAVSLLADPNYVRAWPGGAGSHKLGSNYGPTVFLQKQSEARGYQQILWLFGDDHQLTEAGTMNIFVYLINENGEKELVTPKLEDGLILPGITRMSILELTREWNEFKVSERRITMSEVLKARKEGRLLEIFGAGTACSVCPVATIGYLKEDYHIPTMDRDEKDSLNLRIFKTLKEIQYGDKSHSWTLEIPSR